MRFSAFPILGFAALSLLTTGCAGHAEFNKIKALIQDEKNEFTSQVVTNITQVLSLYGFALDLKEFSKLDDVYTEDTVVDLGRGPINGLEALKRYYITSAGNTTTQHSSQNVYVYDVTETSASALSDAVAVFFRQGPTYPGSNILLLNNNDTLTFYERFSDKLSRGDDGLWRISARVLTILV